MNKEERITYLESKVTKEIEDKYYPKFEKSSRYIGNGVYEMRGLKARDTRVLFLKFCLRSENIKFTQEDD